jgi:hypothetical protein
LQDLDEAARRYLAWESILTEKVVLNLDPQQVKQAESQLSTAEGTVTARLPETYQWLLVPTQATPQAAVEWQPLRLSGQDTLAVRASKKLRSDELLLTGFAATRLRMELDRVPLWRGDHVAIKQLADDLPRYIYLPRLKDSSVLIAAVRDGLALLTWEHDAFAFADSFDESGGRYQGLRGGQIVTLVDADAPGLLVKPEVARRQLDAETVKAASVSGPEGPTGDGGTGSNEPDRGTSVASSVEPVSKQPKRFHGTVKLDEDRVGRDASRIADEVIAHLTGLVGAKVTVTLEVEAEIPTGAPDHVVRTVTENSRTLKFTTQEFERE